jgi:hypothetical protein
MNLLEVRLLDLLQWRLFVSPTEYQQHIRDLSSYRRRQISGQFPGRSFLCGALLLPHPSVVR